jgi:hypothetical protein
MIFFIALCYATHAISQDTSRQEIYYPRDKQRLIEMLEDVTLLNSLTINFIGETGLRAKDIKFWLSNTDAQEIQEIIQSASLLAHDLKVSVVGILSPELQKENFPLLKFEDVPSIKLNESLLSRANQPFLYFYAPGDGVGIVYDGSLIFVGHSSNVPTFVNIKIHTFIAYFTGKVDINPKKVSSQLRNIQIISETSEGKLDFDHLHILDSLVLLGSSDKQSGERIVIDPLYFRFVKNLVISDAYRTFSTTSRPVNSIHCVDQSPVSITTNFRINPVEFDGKCSQVSLFGDLDVEDLDFEVSHLIVDRINEDYLLFRNPSVKVFTLLSSGEQEVALFTYAIAGLPNLERGEFVISKERSISIELDDWLIEESTDSDYKKYTFTRLYRALDLVK